ncbi:tektin-4 [Carlito syrichta]|uniref:Tektin n=1 Tax=Carlito syrichta TaxID=1868482 RepID=A0A3Q0DMP4_CARSF|nr:tektin-4 [Carlito syrichta]
MAQTDVLLTRQPAPQTVPPCELPPKVYDVARNTGTHTSSGLATAGFRTAKYLADEWFQNCYARYHQAFTDRDSSERQRHESQQLAAETEALAQRTQQDSTRRLGARLQDAHGWKSELQRQVEALDAETDLLLAQKQRLERALDATAVPFSIVTDNLQSRERRQHPDLVRDRVEMELLKEAELIRNIQELLKRTIMQAVTQIRLNRQHKETCELDWSDKVEAYAIDETCSRYSSQSTEVQAHPHSSKLEESWCWGDRWHCPTPLLHVPKWQTLREITDQEHNVAALKQAIKDKEMPLRVAQSRLYQRSHRPGVELCRDTAQFRLVSEVEELDLSLAALKEKLLEAEQSLHHLEDTRMDLEKDIAVKTNSLFIDRQKCLARRTCYPSVLQLAGHQ